MIFLHLDSRQPCECRRTEVDASATSTGAEACSEVQRCIYTTCFVHVPLSLSSICSAGRQAGELRLRQPASHASIRSYTERRTRCARTTSPSSVHTDVPVSRRLRIAQRVRTAIRRAHTHRFSLRAYVRTCVCMKLPERCRCRVLHPQFPSALLVAAGSTLQPLYPVDRTKTGVTAVLSGEGEETWLNVFKGATLSPLIPPGTAQTVHQHPRPL